MSGALIMAAAMVALIGIVHHCGAAVSTGDLPPGLALAGLGLGLGGVIAALASMVFGLAFLLMLAPPARRGHNPQPASV